MLWPNFQAFRSLLYHFTISLRTFWVCTTHNCYLIAFNNMNDITWCSEQNHLGKTRSGAILWCVASTGIYRFILKINVAHHCLPWDILSIKFIKLFLIMFYLLTDINDCASVTCHNGGTCIDKVNNFHCQCMHGFTGKYCKEGKCMKGMREVL